jgi:hypothetical protein
LRRHCQLLTVSPTYVDNVAERTAGFGKRE